MVTTPFSWIVSEDICRCLMVQNQKKQTYIFCSIFPEQKYKTRLLTKGAIFSSIFYYKGQGVGLAISDIGKTMSGLTQFPRGALAEHPECPSKVSECHVSALRL